MDLVALPVFALDQFMAALSPGPVVAAIVARAHAMLFSPRRVRAVNRASTLAMAGAASWVASR